MTEIVGSHPTEGREKRLASFVIPFFYATLVFAAVYDFALFGDMTDTWGAAGAVIIVARSLLLVVRDRSANVAAQFLDSNAKN